MDLLAVYNLLQKATCLDWDYFSCNFYGGGVGRGVLKVR